MTRDDRPRKPEDEGDVAPTGARVPPVTTEQILQLNRLALQARFVSGMAHELNNSLQVMSGLAELLSERPDLPDDAAIRIKRIAGQADRASDVIRQVLTYTRDQAVQTTKVDLGPLVDRSLALRRYRLGRVGIEVSWNRPDAPCHVHGDERQLQQVVLNLIVNSEEALVSAPRRHLRCELDCSAEVARFTVADSGPGVPADLRDRIFEPFFTTRSSSHTTGLGLTAAAAIVKAHRGRLFLENTQPGATFVMELPRSAQ